MKKLLVATMALAAASGVANAGPNAGGTLVLHANTAIVYTPDTTNYCGQGGLTVCDAAVSSVTGADPVVFFAVAAFPAASSPRLAGLTFGVAYDAAVTLAAYGSCGDFELTTGAWPNSGEGTAITWNTAQTSHLTEAYWFAGYNYYSPAPANFGLTAHPTQGGKFADDAVPANLDDISDYGRLGFDNQGSAPCPTVVTPTGACCLPNFGPCVVVRADECAQAGGVYQGDGSDCDPNPCPPPPATGACCIGTDCTITTAEGCNGEYQGNDTNCDPNPCEEPVATESKTWGAIKADYRK
ncbi:MAG: hypothetical protein IT349_18110 [Candidatus Eisenbacteria bacterium]|nr:hypothetical protein [Candidatus Eisenbacteria bacterium]